MKVKGLLNYLLAQYPLELASNFDYGKLGLQIGSGNTEITKVLLTLDVTLEVIEEAIKVGANVIISHHPFIFEPLLQINYDSLMGKKLQLLINHNINVINLHTNLDVAQDGMNDFLAKKLGLTNIEPSEIITDASQLLRTGAIEKMPLKSLIKRVQESLNEVVVRYVGSPSQMISKVGIVGGSGATELNEALALGCDCFITGEIKHHHALYAIEKGIALIEVSHSVEALYLDHLLEKLQKVFPELIVSKTKKAMNPFNFECL